MGKLEDELNEMEKALEEPEDGVDDLRTDPPGTAAPGTDPAVTEAPGTQAPGTEAPGTAAPGTSAPSTEAPHTEAPAEDPRDKELRELREENARLKGPKTKAPKTEAPSTDAPITEEDFIGDIDLDEVSRDPKAFNELMNKIRKSGIEYTRAEVKKAVENVIRSIPDIVKNNVALTATLKEVNERFYNDNEDLKPWKKTVAAVFEEKAAENPDKSYNDLLPEVATETRKRLGLKKDATKHKDTDTPPRLPRKKGGPRQQPKPDTDPLMNEMDEMDKALGLD